jgi:hypothetical protein
LKRIRVPRFCLGGKGQGDSNKVIITTWGKVDRT